MDNKPRRTNVGLDNVFRLWASVFEAGRNMFDNGFAEDFVEFGSFDFEMARGVDFGSKFKKFGDVLAGFAASDKNWSVR